MEILRALSCELLNLKNDKKILCLITVIGVVAFSTTYIYVAKEENKKAEEKAKTEIVYKYFVE